MKAFHIFILLITLPTLAGLLIFLIKKQSTLIPVVIGCLLINTFLAFFGLFQFPAPELIKFSWLPSLTIGWNVDRAAWALMGLVSFISCVVCLFSVYYMKHDKGIFRYFLILGSFVSSMIGLIAADHLLLLFVFWELVGFFSYLLIGFWFDNEAKSEAARNAFITNRIADVGFLTGIVLLWACCDSLFISEWNLDWQLPVGVAFGLLIGAMGKSAQFPFHTWLPKAMAGPTPVSALIHAATMVAAGVYLLFRISPFIPPEMKGLIALIGAITALVSGYIACFQFDIKKVLAYSTISQLGFMFMAVGAAGSGPALFHLWTHAFFKAGLFLCAGAVIHFFQQQKVKDAQDIRSMGGIWKVMPVTFLSFTICMFALIGLPFFTGFLSKDAILLRLYGWSTYESSWLSWLVFIVALISVVLTGFYMMRLWKFTFLGTPKEKRVTDEPFLTVKLPLLMLAILSLWFWYSLNPLGHDIFFLNWFSGAQEASNG